MKSTANEHGAQPGAVRRLMAVALNACVARYGLGQPSGVLLLLVSVLDPFVYAGVVYFVLETVFQRDDFARFHLILIGFLIFRWTISCLIQATNLDELRERFAEVCDIPRLAALTAVMAPPTAVFMLALLAANIFSLLAPAPGRSLAGLWWLPLAVLIQAAWTVALVLVVDLLRRRRWLTSETPILALGVVAWFLSPVMYRFDDIPAAASKILTSYNPVSHMLAAYHNAYWYGQPISFRVIPVATVGALALIAVLWRRARIRAAEGVPAIAGSAPDQPHLAIVTAACAAAEAVPLAAGTRVFRRWRGELDALSGRDLVRLVLATRDGRLKQPPMTVEGIRRTSEIGRLFEDDISVYPDWAKDQIALAAAIESPFRDIVLLGLLDAAPAEFVAAAWRQLEAEAAAGRGVTVVAHRPLALGESARGSFTVIGPDGRTIRGPIGPELQAACEQATDGRGTV